MEIGVLIRYLRDIVDLETRKRIAANTYNRIIATEKNYAYVNNASIPIENSSSGVTNKIVWLIVLGIKIYLGFVVGGVAGALLGSIPTLLFEIPPEIRDFISIVCGFIGCIWVVRRERQKTQVDKEQKRQNQIQYAKDVEKGKIILAQIQKDKPRLKNIYDECDRNLKKMYALNIVHPQYQYLEACGMFLQYLGTGRTHSLVQSGADAGAYNLYETDLKFERINKKLEQVLNNQQVLYGVLKDINNNVESLCGSVERIEQYAKQTAYNTKISAWCNTATAANTYAMRRMQEEYALYRG